MHKPITTVFLWVWTAWRFQVRMIKSILGVFRGVSRKRNLDRLMEKTHWSEKETMLRIGEAVRLMRQYGTLLGFDGNQCQAKKRLDNFIQGKSKYDAGVVKVLTGEPLGKMVFALLVAEGDIPKNKDAIYGMSDTDIRCYRRLLNHDIQNI